MPEKPMTVRELIENLKTMPPHAEVQHWPIAEGHDLDVFEVFLGSDGIVVIA